LVDFVSDLKVSQTYFNSIQLRSQNNLIKKYWSDVFLKQVKNKKFHYNNKLSSYDTLNNSVSTTKGSLFFLKNNVLINSSIKNKKLNESNVVVGSIFFKDVQIKELNIHVNVLSNLKKTKIFKQKYLANLNELTKPNNSGIYHNYKLRKKNLLHADNFENSRFLKKSTGNNTPFRLIKLTRVGNSEGLFKVRDNFSNISQSKSKDLQKSIYFTFKQKRYKKRKIISSINYSVLDRFGEKTSIKKKTIKPDLKNFTIKDTKDNTTNYFNLIKKNKIRNDSIFGVYNKRLLRTNKILVLPAHVNITAITNSYDVIHSWFIPGLGLKLDCIPGRSTHHTFYIDNIGFYYGQCAEVCGRYHHHMPIKICSLPFEHFLVW
jgi:hypothetical protein